MKFKFIVVVYGAVFFQNLVAESFDNVVSDREPLILKTDFNLSVPKEIHHDIRNPFQPNSKKIILVSQADEIEIDFDDYGDEIELDEYADELVVDELDENSSDLPRESLNLDEPSVSSEENSERNEIGIDFEEYDTETAIENNDDVPAIDNNITTDDNITEETVVDSVNDVPEDIIEVDDVEVFGDPIQIITPLPGVELDESQITTNVQTATGDDIKESRAVSLTSFLNEELQSVTVSDFSGNPFQQNINFRGFTASPLIATPQGLSVYLDGVRVNEAFGEVVNWDLIPLNAIDGLALLPGSDPLFGLNTLGGAISLNTKNGFTSDGFEAEVSGGSWGRRQTQFNGGFNRGNFAMFTAFNGLNEDGWRDSSPSQVRQIFNRIDVKHRYGQVTFTTTFANNSLVGNGTVPIEDLTDNPTAVYTAPDRADNDLLQFQLTGRFNLSDTTNLSFMGYRRMSDQMVMDGNFWDDFEFVTSTRGGQCFLPDDPSAMLDPNGALARTTGAPNCFPNGVFTNSFLEQESFGFSLQLDVRSRKNYFVAGATFDRYDTRFGQTEQLGFINEDRIVEVDPNRLVPGTPCSPTAFDRTGPFADFISNFLGCEGFLLPVSRNSDILLDTPIIRNNITGNSSTIALFFKNVWQPTESLNISFGARYNYTEVSNYLESDQAARLFTFTQQTFQDLENICGLNTGVPNARFQCTDESFTYEALNPSFGVSWIPKEDINFFANVSRGTRNPSAIELACARDPDPQMSGRFSGCAIPTSFTSDPFLPNVTAISSEFGFRFGDVFGFDIDAAVFRTTLEDDILFVSEGFGNLGVFDTFEKTRRQGIELAFSQQQGPFRWFAKYTYLEATFESEATIANPSNSTAINTIDQQDNLFTIQPGDFIPGQPKHTLGVGVDFDLFSNFSFGVNMVAQGSSFVKGNENNDHLPGGSDNAPGFFRDREIVGDGIVPGFAIFNLNATYYVQDFMSVFLKVDNIFDKRHFNGGNLGLNAFTPAQNGLNEASGFNTNSNDWTHSKFVAPGAPRAAWVGLNFTF